MGKSDEARLGALLDDIDWTTVPAEHDSFDVLPRLPAILPCLVKAALTTSPARASTLVNKAEGTSQFGVFGDFPVHGADVYLRLLPEASSVGVSWLLRELRRTAETLVSIDGYPDALFDEFSQFVLERRAVIDGAFGDDVERLGNVAELATLIEALQWRTELAETARALGATDVLQGLSARPRLIASSVDVSRSTSVPSQRARDLVARELPVPFGVEKPDPVHVMWRRGATLRDAVLYGRFASSSAGRRSVFWDCESRSDRRAFAALAQALRRDLEEAKPLTSVRPPLWREVVVRAWIGDVLKEVRYRRGHVIPPFMGATQLSGLLKMLEPPRR